MGIGLYLQNSQLILARQNKLWEGINSMAIIEVKWLAMNSLSCLAKDISLDQKESRTDRFCQGGAKSSEKSEASKET